jgi:hypothetical protein
MDDSLKKALFNQAGLPANSLENFFNNHAAKMNKSTDDLSLEDIREIMADMLQDVLLEAKRSSGGTSN